MSLANWAQAGVFLVVVTLLVRPLGGYMARVFAGERTVLDPALRPLERLVFRVGGVDARREMAWPEYAASFVLLTLAGTLLLYAVLRLQSLLPWYFPERMTTPLTPDLAFNTSLSFTTTTTWQAYAGETTMSYVSQLVALTVGSFLGGASGLAVGVAFVRGLARRRAETLGNFWVDVVRALLWVLLPLSLAGGLVLVWQGVPMTFGPYLAVSGLEGAPQAIARGPVAALEVIKNLGTNGGGFFNVNAAHPYANPTPATNVLALLAIAVLPAAFTNTFGRMVGRPREGWLLYWVMVALFVAGLVACTWAEAAGNPRVGAAGVAGGLGNMEGKEVRFGAAGSALAAVVTSDGATGSSNSMHDSYTPLGGLVPLVNMQLGEIVFGGLGSGVYSIVLLALLGLFLTGLMVGRTPEYLGKQIGPDAIKLIMLYALAAPLATLVLTALAVVVPAGLAGLTTNDGPHGFTEVVYAYSSAFANNGQSFAGLSANSPFSNVTTAVAMVLGRFALAIPALALAGHFARQGVRPRSLGTLPTDGPLFGTVLVGTVLIVAALTYFPALALGPIVEHLRLAVPSVPS
jgi:K+-transporting ATPase ATPase A chain